MLRKIRFLVPILLISLLLQTCKFKESVKPDTSGLFVKLLGTANDEDLFDVVQTTDGGFVCVGQTTITTNSGLVNSTTTQQSYIAKVDESGNRLWQKVFPGGVIRSIQNTTDGNLIMVGDTNVTSSDSDMLVIKANNDGRIIWQRNFGSGGRNEKGYNIKTTSDGGLLVIGNIFYTNSNVDMFLVKISSAGDLVFLRNYGLTGLNNQIGNAIENRSGRILWSGTSFKSSNSTANVRVVNANSDGVVLWDYFYGGDKTSTGFQIKELSDNGYIVVGANTGLLDNKGGTDAYLLRLDENGIKIWEQSYGGPLDDAGLSVQVCNDGGFIVAGITASFGSGKTDVYVIKTDSQGNVQWFKTFGGTGDDQGKSVLQTKDGGFLVGATLNFENNNNMAVIRINSQGSLVK